jgi:Tfp pilus assembly protein PilP
MRGIVVLSVFLVLVGFGGAQDAGKKELAKWAPETSAESKPDRTAYDFDFPSYTWKLRKP